MPQGGSFKDALLAGVSAAALSWAGGAFLPEGGLGMNWASSGYVATVGTFGGMASVLQGGKFGHGFISAGLGASTRGIKGLAGNGGWKVGGRAAVAAIVSGTSTKVTGGKFANGAITGALLYSVNACSSDPDRCKPFKVIAKEFSKWWTSSETEDLRNGIQATVDVATIPYKAVSAAANAHALIEAGVAAKNGSYGDAAVKALSVVAGKSVTTLIPSGAPGGDRGWV